MHKVLLACIVVACKFYDDFYAENTWYALLGGVETKELNLMEGHICQMLGWNFHIDNRQPMWTFLLQQLNRFRYNSVTT